MLGEAAMALPCGKPDILDNSVQRVAPPHCIQAHRLTINYMQRLAVGEENASFCVRKRFFAAFCETGSQGNRRVVVHTLARSSSALHPESFAKLSTCSCSPSSRSHQATMPGVSGNLESTSTSIGSPSWHGVRGYEAFALDHTHTRTGIYMIEKRSCFSLRLNGKQIL